jgi:hypothetical protein
MRKQDPSLSHRRQSTLMLFLALAAGSAVAGKAEAPYVSLDLLSPAEVAFFADAARDRRVTQQPGDFAVVFPNGRLPLLGAEAEQFVLSGGASIVTFGGLINTYAGAMNLGKLVAARNAAPVLAVHSGYGDEGLLTQGPKAFHFERELNLLQLKYTDAAIAPVVKLLKRLEPRPTRPVTLLGYCLGGLKVANVAYTLSVERPEVLSSLGVMVFGLGVNLPPGLARHVQFAGSKDQFGRINTTNPLATFTLAGRSHSLRVDLPDSLPMVPVDRAFSPEYRRIDEPQIDAERLSAADLAEETAAMARQVAGADELVSEAIGLSNGGVSDQLHLLKMKRERALLAARLIELRLAARAVDAEEERLQRELIALRRAEAQVCLRDFEYLQRFRRTLHSDFLEYEVWKAKSGFQALTES